MTGEISIFGIFLPLLFALSIAALVLNQFVTHLLRILGVYHYFTNRPIVDMTCFLVILWLLSWVSSLKVVA